MKSNINIRKLRPFLILWSTQGLSQLGSAMTGFALTLWMFEKTGSALDTAMLSVCSYAPYVLMSIFAGALTDKLDKKRTMLVCDAFAAACTLGVLILYRADALAVWQLYLINALTGLMNTMQAPASDVALTLIVPRECYQQVSGLYSLSRSLVSILHPLIATALYAIGGLTLVIIVDLATFSVAFLALLLFIRVPRTEQKTGESFAGLVRGGLAFLKGCPLVLNVMLFMAGVNFTASAFDAVLPAFVLRSPAGGTAVLGVMSSCSGIAMVIGSLLITLMPKPRNRVRVIYLTMLFSLGTENFVLAFTRTPVLWYAAQIIGWILVPVMSASEDVILRSTIPVELQGRVYACRNSLQFFTIPLGLMAGGVLTDDICEPLMAGGVPLLEKLFTGGPGLAMFILGILGVIICLAGGRRLRGCSFEEAPGERS